MLLFEISRFIRKSKIRIVIVVLLLLLASVFSKNNVYELLRVSNLLPDNAVLSVPDFLIGILNSTQFVMYFIFPVLFSILIADIITADFNERLINFILPRLKNRFQYIITKCTMVFLMSILFTCFVFITALLVAVSFNMPFNHNKYHYIFLITAKSGGSMFITYMSMVTTFIIGLTFIGLITLVVSFYTRSAGVAIGVIIILSFIHNAFYVVSSDLIIWLPFSQYIVGLHNHFAPYGIPVRYFTMHFSNIYLFVGIALMIVLLILKIRKVDINNVESKG